MQKIRAEEITAVIQGPISEITAECISSIRKFLPQAKIIVSTSDTAQINNMDCDELVLNTDVGANFTTLIEANSKPNNINRQITSTLSGLKKVKTKYTLKIRSDFILTGNSFLEYFDKYNNFNDDERFFEKRILICSLFSKHPRKSKSFRLKGTGFPYHPSDFVQFGLTNDLLKLWNVDLVSDEDLDWFTLRPTVQNEEPFRHRYSVEQQIFVQFMKKNNITYFADFFYDRSEKNAAHTDLIMANNFVILPFKKFCVKPSKETFEITSQPYYSVCYTEKDWQNLYKKYCDKNIRTKFIDTEFIQALYFNWPTIFGIHSSYYSMISNFHQSLKSDKLFTKRIKSALLSLFYLIKLLLKLLPRLISAFFSCLKK